MKKFELQPGEKLLVNDPHAMWMKSDMMGVQGQLKLTDRRLVFVKNANPFAGLLVLFFKSLQAQVLIEFPLNEITEISRSAFVKSTRLVVGNGKERSRNFVV
jgi:hypothetical protein